jgi:hypothetical protein
MSENARFSPQTVDFPGFRRYPSGRERLEFLHNFHARLAPGEGRDARGGGCQMTSFEDREKSFERKFALDEELRFRSTARRNKLLGLWAAEKLGLAGDAAQAYAREVIKADLAEPGDEDVFRKIRADFDAKGVEQSDHQIRRAMTDLMVEAVTQIETESHG